MKAAVQAAVAATRSAHKDLVARWNSSTGIERATTVLLAFMIVGGVILRIQGIGFPPRLTFDEQFYGPTSHHFLSGVPDLHDYHPPLGKLLGAIGLLLYGFNSLGWRFAYLCFGLQTLVIAYFLAREIFADRRAGWFAAAFFAADGFFISYSRAGLIDGMLTCLVLWSMLAIVTARTWRGVLATAVLLGAAASIKWSGAMTLIPATVALLVLRRVRWYQMFWFAVTPVVHLAIWIAGLRLMGHANDVTSLWAVLSNSFTSLAATGVYSNPLASSWYTWPLLYHPIVVKLAQHGAHSHYASSAGNPVFWFPASFVVLGLPLAKGAALVKERWRHWWPNHFDPTFTRAAMLLSLGWLALIVMWSMVLGKHSFFYHYQPSYGFALVLLAGFVAKLERRDAGAVLAYVGLAVLVAIFFAPVWGEFALSELEANRRLIFLPWRP